MKMSLKERYEIAGRLYTINTIITEATFDFRNGDISWDRFKEKVAQFNKLVDEVENERKIRIDKIK